MTAHSPQPDPDAGMPSAPTSSPFEAFVEDNLTILGQALEFVGRLEPEAYGRPHPELGLSSIGSHLRHIVDFYLRFLETAQDLDVQAANCDDAPLLDYDKRERNVELETNPALAGEVLRSILDRMRALPHACAGHVVTIRTDCVDPKAQHVSRSTVERELQSLTSHTVHHYALIKIAAGRVGVDPGREFGVAPSTLRYWERTGACAP